MWKGEAWFSSHGFSNQKKGHWNSTEVEPWGFSVTFRNLNCIDKNWLLNPADTVFIQ